MIADAAALVPAARLALLGAGVFFLAGLVSGIWKYAHIAQRGSSRSASAKARRAASWLKP